MPTTLDSLLAATGMATAPGTALHMSSDGRRAVVAAAGQFDLHNADHLVQVLGQAAELGRDVDVDLRRVTFLDAYAVGEIAWAGERLQRCGHRLRAVRPQPNVRKVIALLRPELLPG
jgi:anti-anti-sigma factor